MPIPVVPFVRFFNVFAGPFTLVVHLFTGVLTKRVTVLILAYLVFVSTDVKPTLGKALAITSILFGVFVGTLRLLITFVRTCIFAVLSTIFVNLTRRRRGRGTIG